jgi:hypothetical protein
MVDTFKQLLGHQFEAALCTLGVCINRCPEAGWNGPVGNLAFCQVAFHTLFFADFYLGPSEAALRAQPFHRDYPAFFRDYEELQSRKQQLLYDRATVNAYLDHCRSKASQAVAAESAQSLAEHCGFERREMSRAELHVYNIRHIQHHAAQLSLRLRIDFGVEVPWVASGWTMHTRSEPGR